MEEKIVIFLKDNSDDRFIFSINDVEYLIDTRGWEDRWFEITMKNIKNSDEYSMKISKKYFRQITKMHKMQEYEKFEYLTK